MKLTENGVVWGLFLFVVVACLGIVACQVFEQEPVLVERFTHCPKCGEDLSKSFSDVVEVMGPDAGYRWQECPQCKWASPKTK